MVRTYGLTHVALAVKDVGRSSRFYQRLLGAVEVYRESTFAQLQTPGTRDVIVLQKQESDGPRAGQAGGVIHFGFRLMDPTEIHLAATAIVEAGGRILSQGDFCPGEPYVFAHDPDGYEIELWYELPTPVDPPAAPRDSSAA